MATVGVLELAEAFHRDRLSNFSGGQEEGNPPTFEDSRTALAKAQLWWSGDKEFAYCCTTDKDIERTMKFFADRFSGVAGVQGQNSMPAVRGLLVAGVEKARGGTQVEQWDKDI